MAVGERMAARGVSERWDIEALHPEGGGMEGSMQFARFPSSAICTPTNYSIRLDIQEGDMSRRLLAAAILGIAAQAAAAEPFSIPNKGGVYCTDPDKLQAMVAGALKGDKSVASDGCGMLAAGLSGDAKIVSDTGGIKLGVGKFPGVASGKVVSFVAVAAETKKPFAERAFKTVSPDDVRNTPTKWQDRDIEFSRVNVYWVDDGDVRFVTGTAVTVFASKVQGADVEAIKRRCETQKEALSAQCRVSIKFSYDEFDEDKPNGYSTRVVLKTSDVLIEKPGGKTRRR